MHRVLQRCNMIPLCQHSIVNKLPANNCKN
ncbi:hypothetical protein EMIT0373P_60577 [Pseudomonas chlororaphis]